MTKKSIRVLNTSEYLKEQDKLERVSLDNVEVLNPDSNLIVSSFGNNRAVSAKGISAGKGSLPIPVIDGIINVLNNAINAFRDVAVEREKTNQVRAKARAYIEGQREETNRVRITEKETTKRYEMKIISEIERSKIELTNRKNKIEADLIKNKLDHKKNILFMKGMQDSIAIIMDQHKAYSDMLNLMFNEVINNKTDIDDFCKVASKLNEVEKNLITANENLDTIIHRI